MERGGAAPATRSQGGAGSGPSQRSRSGGREERDEGESGGVVRSWVLGGESGDRVGVRVRGGGLVGQRGGPAGPGGPAGAEASWAARPSVGGGVSIFMFF